MRDKTISRGATETSREPVLTEHNERENPLAESLETVQERRPRSSRTAAARLKGIAHREDPGISEHEGSAEFELELRSTLA